MMVFLERKTKPKILNYDSVEEEQRPHNIAGLASVLSF